MKVHKQLLQLDCIHNKNDFFPNEDVVFFDIETTGFSTFNSNIYLIGCIHQENGKYLATQWLAQDPVEEPLIIHEFFQYLNNFQTLVHFNGDGFDIPYIKAKCKKFLLPYSFNHVKSVDVYRNINKFKNIFKIDNLKQKSLETYLDIARTDTYSGGELINVYQDYAINKNEYLENLLLQHNLDDVVGIISILDILSYNKFFTGEFTVDSMDYTKQNEMLFMLSLSHSLPKRLTYGFGPYFLSAYDKEATVRVKIYTDELKFFYPNYTDYYYLPVEDVSIHKSVAFYVDKNFRTKAKAANCYSKKTGRFLPQYKEVISPYFKIDYYDKITYFELTQEFISNEHLIKNYVMHTLDFLLNKKHKQEKV